MPSTTRRLLHLEDNRACSPQLKDIAQSLTHGLWVCSFFGRRKATCVVGTPSLMRFAPGTQQGHSVDAGTAAQEGSLLIPIATESASLTVSEETMGQREGQAW